MSNICCVVPTVRPEQYEKFLEAWSNTFVGNDVLLITVWDGENPVIKVGSVSYSVRDIMGEHADLIYNRNDGVRNAGFALIAKEYPEIEYIITLDDDVMPCGDTIKDHIEQLNRRVPISGWLNTIQYGYPRGFPYETRGEARVMVSHGLWTKNPDWDAPTQLVNGNVGVAFNRFTVPRGVTIPFCGMNVAFRREVLPYMYYAPMGYRVGLDRFADIWLGRELTGVLEKNNWAMVSGYAVVEHTRASNVWTNLQKEALGLSMNENYGEGDYFKLYRKEREGYARYIQSLLDGQSRQN